MSRRIPGLDEAITRLANEFENGNLMASTDPVGFIDTVAAEIARLQAALDSLQKEYDQYKEMVGESLMKEVKRLDGQVKQLQWKLRFESGEKVKP